MQFKKYRDLLLGIVMLALGIGYTALAQQIPEPSKFIARTVKPYASASIVPTLLGILLIALSVMLIVKSVIVLKKNAGSTAEVAEKKKSLDFVPVVLTFAVMALYIVLLDMLGFMLATMIYLFLQILVLSPKEKRNIPLFLIVAVVFTILVFVAFRIGLSQMLPRGYLEALIGY